MEINIVVEIIKSLFRIKLRMKDDMTYLMSHGKTKAIHITFIHVFILINMHRSKVKGLRYR